MITTASFFFSFFFLKMGSDKSHFNVRDKVSLKTVSTNHSYRLETKESQKRGNELTDVGSLQYQPLPNRLARRERVISLCYGKYVPLCLGMGTASRPAFRSRLLESQNGSCNPA